ncbi:MAG: hypothetical protein SH850_01520 [Planctomycetaceae bacterium]|nr:hypothetical protein [Planctomycetaceae bacterium]
MAKHRPIQQLTYREKIRDATQLSRELIDHVGQSLLPRIAQLQSQLTHKPHHNDEPIEDVTIRSTAATVLDSERYADQLIRRLEELGEAIVQESNQILSPNG